MPTWVLMMPAVRLSVCLSVHTITYSSTLARRTGMPVKLRSRLGCPTPTIAPDSPNTGATKDVPIQSKPDPWAQVL